MCLHDWHNEAYDKKDTEQVRESSHGKKYFITYLLAFCIKYKKKKKRILTLRRGLL